MIHAPLKAINLDENIFDWYETEGLPVRDIDMLVIDGPPGFIQKNSRFPALPILHSRLSKNITVFLDDAARSDERELVGNWLEKYPELAYLYIENERGCVVLKTTS